MRVKHLGQICVGPTLSEAEIGKLRRALSEDNGLEKRLRLHRLLSGETRYKILKLLADLNELCVCDLAEILETTVSAVSHQLKVLRNAGVVATRRQGQTIYYSLKDREINELL
jgi:ArsR family transcriptional regulator